MNYRDLLKPATFANDAYFHELAAHTRAHDPLPYIESDTYRLLRFATEDYALRGKRIKQGDALMMLYPSANRDEEVFDAPFRFIADRRPNRHIAFGHGAHHCLGNLLAKMEMKHLYQELFSRINTLELIGEPRLVHSNFVSGLKNLPIRFTPK